MLASELLDLRGRLHKQGVIFAYSGYVTEPVLSGVGEAFKQKLTIDDADTKTLRSVFAVFVEQMQNMIRYSRRRRRAAAARLRRQGAHGNSLRHLDHRQGRQGLRGLRRQSCRARRCRASAREAHPDPRHEQGRAQGALQGAARAAPEEGSKGAGLGFMEIARRASKPIEFDFADVNDTHAFFALKATI